MAKRPALEPLEEFYLVAAHDVACSDLGDIKDVCLWYDSADDALTEAAAEANGGDGEGHAQVVYRVTKYVEVK